MLCSQCAEAPLEECPHGVGENTEPNMLCEFPFLWPARAPWAGSAAAWHGRAGVQRRQHAASAAAAAAAAAARRAGQPAQGRTPRVACTRRPQALCPPAAGCCCCCGRGLVDRLLLLLLRQGLLRVLRLLLRLRQRLLHLRLLRILRLRLPAVAEAAAEAVAEAAGLPLGARRAPVRIKRLAGPHCWTSLPCTSTLPHARHSMSTVTAHALLTLLAHQQAILQDSQAEIIEVPKQATCVRTCGAFTMPSRIWAWNSALVSCGFCTRICRACTSSTVAVHGAVMISHYRLPFEVC